MLAAPLVFRAPSGPAAREIATREPKGSEVSISKPARALRTLRRPPHQWRLRCCVVMCRLEARPGLAAAHGRRSPPVPSGPSGALLTGGSRLVLCNFACNSLTSVVYGSTESLEFQRLHADT